MKTLVIAEKPSVARDLAKVLSPGAERHASYWEGPRIVFSWALGHLVGLSDASAYNPRYRTWRLEDLPIAPASLTYRPLPTGREQLAVLGRLLHRPDIAELVNACDAGREGELIFRLIYQETGAALPVKRLWLSETTPDAIRAGWEHLRPASEFDRLGDAALARAEADWLVGINATRAFSVRHRDKLTIGRVQTPTLALVVRRDLEIRAFVPERFYQVVASFESPSGPYLGLWVKLSATGTVETDRFSTREEAAAVAAHAPTPATVASVRQTPQKLQPPLLPNLSDVQREANRRFGLPAAKTLSLAQALYEA
nr:DNA topoisomerase [Thermaerobacter sp.]